MAVIRPKYLTPVQINHVLVDFVPVLFADGAMHTSGIIDRTANPTFAELAIVNFQYETGTPDGVVEIYAYGDSGPEGGGPTWAFWQAAQAASSLVNLSGEPLSSIGAFKVGEVNMVGATPYQKRLARFNLAEGFGGAIPQRFALICKNDSGVSVWGNGPGGQDAWAIIQGIQAETI